MGIPFDYPHLHHILLAEARADFRTIQERHQKENFYGISFYTNGERSYLYPTASTEEGLERVARHYAQKPYYSKVSLEDLKTELRWSPCDSPLHEECGDYLSKTNKFISSYLWLPPDEAGCVWENPDAEPFCEVFDDVLFSVLQQLDSEGLFGCGELREHLILNLLMGDQSHESRIANAEKLNPASSIISFKRELVACEVVWGKRWNKP